MMEEDKMRGLMIDHIDGKLSGELSNYVQSHIEKNPDARKEYEQLKEVLLLIDKHEMLEVPVEGKSDFQQMLAEQASGERNRSKQISFSSRNVWYGIAAAIALLFLGYTGGKMFDNSEIDALRMEMEETKQLVMMSMTDQSSASQRMKGVLASNEMLQPDEQVLDALILAMNTDDNINVRVAAVNALGNFTGDDKVRNALIDALATQEYPAVQLKLITLMIGMEEKRALKPLQEMINNDEVISSVKDEAQYGIFKLM